MYKYNISAEREFKRVATFKRPPEGFIIMDSYNNDFFPMKQVQIDSSIFNLKVVKDEFHRTYGGSNTSEIFMPFHYSIEMINKNYYVVNNRPIMYKSLIPDYENYISICIIGDTNKDLYSPELYKVMAHMIMNPLHYIQGWRLNPDGHTTYHNLGNHFKKDLLEKHFR